MGIDGDPPSFVVRLEANCGAARAQSLPELARQ
jgi:hypothetical protein